MSAKSGETLLILIAKSYGETVGRHVSAFLTTYQHGKPILTDADLKAMGLKPGPQFDRFLDRLFHARLNADVMTEQAERRFLRRMVP